jgi:hypothetical protein
VFSEKIVEEHGHAPTQHGNDAAKLGYFVPGGEEGYPEECGGAAQEGSVPGAVDSLEVTKTDYCWVKSNAGDALTF